MTEDQALIEVLRRWIAMADDALDVARRETELSPTAAVNRAYYACFYVATAVLLAEGHHYVKHTGVRSGLHKHLVYTHRVSEQVGIKYNKLMKARLAADYKAMMSATIEDARKALKDAEFVVAALKDLLPPSAGLEEFIS